MIESLNICLSHGGGLGDNINLTAYAAAVKKIFPHSFITVIISHYPDVFRDNKVIDRVIKVDTPFFQKYVDSNIAKFDLFVEIRYASKWHFSPKSLELDQVRVFKEKWEKKFRKYRHIFDRFLSDIPSMVGMNKTFYDVAFESGNLDGNIKDQFISIRPNDYKASEKYSGLRVVTISNGAAGGLQTKSWSTVYWKSIYNYLRKIGFYPIQIGDSSDISIEGIEKFSGTIFETAALIKKASFHMGIENGIAHIANTVGTKSVILFGSTPISVFGYKDNINLRSKVCSPCFWNNREWFQWCVIRNQRVKQNWTPPCMMSLTPTDVIKKGIMPLLKERGYDMKYLEPSVDMDESSLKASLYYKEQDILKKSLGTPMEFFETEALQLPLDESSYREPAQMKRVSAILAQVGTGKKVLSIADGGYIGNLLRMQGNDVTVTDISGIRTLRCKFLLKLDSYQCRAEKLPFKDESFDVVVLAEVLEHVPTMSVPLSEAERVTKKNGKLVLTVPVGRRHDAYEHHIKKIEMDNIDNDMIVLGISNIKPHYDKYREFNKEFYK